MIILENNNYNKTANKTLYNNKNKALTGEEKKQKKKQKKKIKTKNKQTNKKTIILIYYIQTMKTILSVMQHKHHVH